MPARQGLEAALAMAEVVVSDEAAAILAADEGTRAGHCFDAAATGNVVRGDPRGEQVRCRRIAPGTARFGFQSPATGKGL